MADRRQNAATAATGYGLVGAGGAIRGRAIDDAHHELGLKGGDRLLPSSLAVYGAKRWKTPNAAKVVRRFAAGTGLATLGAPAAGLGTYELLKHRRKVAKSGTVTQGVQGVGEAWKQKGQSLRSGAPVRARLVPIVMGAGGGALAALATHRGLDVAGKAIKHEIGGGRRSALTAMATIPGTLATIPASRRVTRRYGYTVTPTGTHKLAKSLKVLPWDGPRYAVHNTRGRVRIHEYHGNNRFTVDDRGNLAIVHRSTLTFLKDKVAKAAQDYRGRHVSYGQQRAATMAIGATPLAGPLLAARQAGKYAPPGQEGRAQARQLAAPAVGLSAAVGAGRMTFKHAQHSPGFADKARRAYQGLEGQHAKLSPTARKVIRLKPYAKLGEKAPAIAAGLLAAKVTGTAVGLPASQVAISRDIAAQRRHNRHRQFDTASINKADNMPMTTHQRSGLVRRKRIGAALNVAGGTTGLAGLALIGAKHPSMLARREKIVAGAAGVGGINAFNSASINRREASAEHKAISKANPPIQTQMNDQEAHKLVHAKGGYGLTGPLPHGLDRPTKMRAYEARYVASGGRKSQRWQHVKQAADVARNVGIAGATAAGVADLASHSARAKKIVAPLHTIKRFERMNSHKVREAATRAAVGSATLAGGAELAEEGAQRRRARYSSAPGGVAASALRRMQAYSPPQ